MSRFGHGTVAHPKHFQPVPPSVHLRRSARLGTMERSFHRIQEGDTDKALTKLAEAINVAAENTDE
jgi:hypothetical protein